MEFLYPLFTKIFGCLGLVLLTITLISPFWLKITAPHFSFTMGLWSICADKICTTLEVYSVMFQVYRGFMTISIFLGMLAIATSYISRLRRFQLAIITNISTGLLSLITMLLYCLWVSMKLLHDGHGFSLHINFSWTFVAGCCGSSMFILCGFLNIFIEFNTLSRIHPRSRIKLVSRSQDSAVVKNIIKQKRKSSFV